MTEWHSTTTAPSTAFSGYSTPEPLGTTCPPTTATGTSAIVTPYRFRVTLVYQSQAGTDFRQDKLVRVGQAKDGS